jgi:cytochrome c oxidase assembly protein subunit 15
MSPSAFRRLATVAWVFQALIVVSGAAVRLTSAGLGCEDWPSCTEDRLVPEWELHGWIEFGNRLISLVVTVSTVALVVGAHRRRPRRTDLVALSWGLVAGTVGQIVLGGVTVLLDLNPIVVSGHFLVSMILLWVAQLLWLRADPAGPPGPVIVADDLAHRLLRLVLPLATLVLLTGTVVTGSGPHSGDSRADRLGFSLSSVARVHSVTVWLLVACVLALAVRLTLRPEAIAVGTGGGRGFAGLGPRAIVRILLALAVAQGAVGYTQFALGVPAGLVELHVAGAILVWMLALALQLRVFDRPPELGPPSRAGVSSGRVAAP